MREIILDTETTGLDPSLGHRIVEIGAVELENHVPTGKTYHVYLDPERDMPPEAEAVHGLSNAFLRGKPRFAQAAGEFLAFTAGSPLVIHNAGFDMAFLNAELSYIGKPALLPERVIDTLHLARQKHPAGPNSLDALCRRYGIDSTKRTKHGALLDSELLAEVYLELIGGRQTVLSLTSRTATPKALQAICAGIGGRTRPLPPRLGDDEKARHEAFVEALGPQALWKASSG